MKSGLSNRSQPNRIVTGPLATDVFREHNTRVITYKGAYVQGALYASCVQAQLINAATGLPLGTDPNQPDGIEFLEVTMGTRGNVITFEADVRQGVAIPVAGEVIEVNVKSPRIVATIPQVPVLGDVTVEFIPGAVVTSPGAMTRTVRYGDIAPVTSSAYQPIPKYASDAISVGIFTSGKTVEFQVGNSTSASNGYYWQVQGSSARSAIDISAWFPVPARCSRARLSNNDAVATWNNAAIVYRLAL